MCQSWREQPKNEGQVTWPGFWFGTSWASDPCKTSPWKINKTKPLPPFPLDHQKDYKTTSQKLVFCTQALNNLVSVEIQLDSLFLTTAQNSNKSVSTCAKGGCRMTLQTTFLLGIQEPRSISASPFTPCTRASKVDRAEGQPSSLLTQPQPEPTLLFGNLCRHLWSWKRMHFYKPLQTKENKTQNSCKRRDEESKLVFGGNHLRFLGKLSPEIPLVGRQRWQKPNGWLAVEEGASSGHTIEKRALHPPGLRF